MSRKYGKFIFIGTAIGIILSIPYSMSSENVPLGLFIGGLVGTFLGWFIAVALQKKSE